MVSSPFDCSSSALNLKVQVSDRLEIVPVTIESGSKHMGSPFRVNPPGDRHKVRDKALDVAPEDDVIAEDHGLKVHVHPVILTRNCKQKAGPR